VLGTRSFGDDESAVSRIGLAWLRGLASAGVRGCVKHYPGHGGTVADTHLALARLPEEPEASRHRVPFVSIADAWREADGPAPSVMPGHLVRSMSRVPMTFDDDAIAFIPEGLGPVWTDSLDMGALDRYGDLVTRGRMAVDAGADLLVVGVDIAGGRKLARSFIPETSPRLARWLRGSAIKVGAPDPLPIAESMAVAARALRHWGPSALPPGEWDWILPVGFGPYGAVPDPVAPQGARGVGRILRYDLRDPCSLAACLGSVADRPALLGWLQRGTHGDAYAAIDLPERVRAIAFLLDVPAMETPSHRWMAETTGFGEPELDALARVWTAAPVADSGD
jgi:hypothetical protein